tara:strand:- start:104 stop:1240 length:1137 start_codon:yes stop_codon:yes gene_type:complete
MVREKHIIFGLCLVFVGIVMLSINPNLTGSVISEGERVEGLFLDKVLPGETVKSSVSLLFADDEIVRQEFYVSGGASNWISLEFDSVSILPNEIFDLPFYVNVPEGTDPGVYRAKIVLIKVQDLEEASILEDSVLDYVPITIKVSENVVEGSEVTQVEAFNAEESNVFYASVDVNNLGNEEVSDSLYFVVQDSVGEIIHEEELSVPLLAFEEKELVYSVPFNLGIGSYSLSVNGVSDSFEVLEGAVTKTGDILFTDVQVDRDRVAHVNVYFKNFGETVLPISVEGDVNEKEFRTEVSMILPGEYQVFEYEYALGEEENYILNVAALNNEIELAQESVTFYSPNAVSLETNFYVVFGLGIILLFVAHRVLRRRKRDSER